MAIFSADKNLLTPALTTQQALAVVRITAQTFRDAVKTTTTVSASAPSFSVSVASTNASQPCSFATQALWRSVIGATLTVLRLQRVLSVPVPSSSVFLPLGRDDQLDTSADDVTIGITLQAVSIFLFLFLFLFFINRNLSKWF
jgi:hypothetical protein